MSRHYRLQLARTVVMTLLGLSCSWADPQPVELGNVQWLRDLDAACQRSRTTGRPVLLLFQEIPGCETCQSFGASPLSHPLMVEAMEDLFVPLAIHNNQAGVDAKVLQEFDEPAWNNPVIRYIDADKRDVIPRRDRVWTVGQTATRMIEALRAADQVVPEYLQMVAEENTGTTETAVFSMHCYWEGESQLGRLSGVENTVSGWLRGKEVVEVTFDPRRLPFADVVAAAKKVKCADDVFAISSKQSSVAADHGWRAVPLSNDESVRPAKDSDQKYYLRQSVLRHLPLTPLQATRINAALRGKQDPEIYLSPRQVKLLQLIVQRTKVDPHALDDYVYPPSSDRLAAYDQELRARLAGEEPR